MANVHHHIEGKTFATDLRGTLGVDKYVLAGFTEIRLRFHIDAPEGMGEELVALLARTERYCTVLPTLRQPPAIEVELLRSGAC